MQVVVVEPNKPAYKGEMPHTLKAMQKVVGGNIEVVYGNNDGTVIVCDEEGKLKGYEGNRKLNNGSIIAGTFFVCGDDGENFCSLSESQAEKYMKLFETPQEISDEEVQEDTKIMFFGL